MRTHSGWRSCHVAGVCCADALARACLPFGRRVWALLRATLRKVRLYHFAGARGCRAGSCGRRPFAKRTLKHCEFIDEMMNQPTCKTQYSYSLRGFVYAGGAKSGPSTRKSAGILFRTFAREHLRRFGRKGTAMRLS